MKRKIRRLIATALLFLTATIAHDSQARIAVFDMTTRTDDLEASGDYSRQLYSAQYLCDIAGYDYFTTRELEEALQADVVLLSGVIYNNTFTRQEYESILNWIKEGGRLLSPAIRSVDAMSSDLQSEIFGINATVKPAKSNSRTLINWNPKYFDDKELEYFDEEEERETSVGEIKTFSISPNGCDILASFNDGGAAVTRQAAGKGKAYMVGLAWRDVVQRNQLNKDQNSSRQYNNGFEPSSDIWAFLLRSIHADAPGVSVWKFTAPEGYTQLLIPTHDCDSRTAYDEMHYMSEYEKSLGLSGHYFLTTHYFSDKENFGHSYLSDFYNDETIPKAKALLADGHTVGSHSVCHFPDFNKVSNTDVVTRDEYAQRATCEDGVSRGASSWAEIVMSKQIIEEDLGNQVKSFRSGHLCVNKDFAAMLKEGDYKFQSCYTGGDILSEFPFFGRYNNDWGGDPSEVLTIQLHISDVYNNKEGEPLNNDTWETHPAPDEWEAAMKKLRGNYASGVLLIHPNRDWKMILQKRLIDRLDLSETGLYNFEAYGEFWLDRLACKYESSYDASTKSVTIITDDLERVERSKMPFAIETNGEPVEKIEIIGKDGSRKLDTTIKQLTSSRILAVPVVKDAPGAVNEISSFDDGIARVYDIHGRLVATSIESENSFLEELPGGIYIYKGNGTTKKIKR